MSATGTSQVATVVVGAGVAGLAAAVEAQQFGDVVVYEASDRVGGTLRSERIDGWLCEHGAASTLLPANGTSTFVATTGASGRLQLASPDARRRWILDDRGMHELSSPPTLLSSGLLSPWALLAALGDRFTAAAPDGTEESVAAFLRRRLGGTPARALAQPVVAGVFAGDAERIDVDAAFPLLRDLERNGGLLRGALRRRKLAKRADAPRPRLYSFTDGMETLPQVAAAYLGDAVRTGTAVRGVEPTGTGWRVVTDDGEATADTVVFACAPEVTATLLRSCAPAAADALDGVERAPVAVVHVGTDASVLSGDDGGNNGDDAHGIGAGFGFLVHPDAGLPILGGVFDSALFDGRAPDGGAMLRVLVGGALAPARVDDDDATLVAAALDGLGVALGRDVTPRFTNVVRHRPGIPQYVLGHRARIDTAAAALRAVGPAAVTGWGCRGVGVNGAVADAVMQVRRLHGA